MSKSYLLWLLLLAFITGFAAGCANVKTPKALPEPPLRLAQAAPGPAAVAG